MIDLKMCRFVLFLSAYQSSKEG